MAKFNVTVNIDYLDDEEGNLDDTICAQIVKAVVANRKLQRRENSDGAF